MSSGQVGTPKVGRGVVRIVEESSGRDPDNAGGVGESPIQLGLHGGVEECRRQKAGKYRRVVGVTRPLLGQQHEELRSHRSRI